MGQIKIDATNIADSLLEGFVRFLINDLKNDLTVINTTKIDKILQLVSK